MGQDEDEETTFVPAPQMGAAAELIQAAQDASGAVQEQLLGLASDLLGPDAAALLNLPSKDD